MVYKDGADGGQRIDKKACVYSSTPRLELKPLAPSPSMWTPSDIVERRGHTQQRRSMLDKVEVDSSSDVAVQDQGYQEKEQSQDDGEDVASLRYVSPHVSVQQHSNSESESSHDGARSTERIASPGYHCSFDSERAIDERLITYSPSAIEASVRRTAVDRVIGELDREMAHITEQIQLLDERRAALAVDRTGRGSERSDDRQTSPPKVNKHLVSELVSASSGESRRRLPKQPSVVVSRTEPTETVRSGSYRAASTLGARARRHVTDDEYQVEVERAVDELRVRLLNKGQVGNSRSNAVSRKQVLHQYPTRNRERQRADPPSDLDVISQPRSTNVVRDKEQLTRARRRLPQTPEETRFKEREQEFVAAKSGKH